MGYTLPGLDRHDLQEAAAVPPSRDSGKRRSTEATEAPEFLRFDSAQLEGFTDVGAQDEGNAARGGLRMFLRSGAQTGKGLVTQVAGGEDPRLEPRGVLACRDGGGRGLDERRMVLFDQLQAQLSLGAQLALRHHPLID